MLHVCKFHIRLIKTRAITDSHGRDWRQFYMNKCSCHIVIGDREFYSYSRFATVRKTAEICFMHECLHLCIRKSDISIFPCSIAMNVYFISEQNRLQLISQLSVLPAHGKCNIKTAISKRLQKIHRYCHSDGECPCFLAEDVRCLNCHVSAP